jgi:hypothetical protein
MIGALAQFGFAGVMAFTIFFVYQRQNERLMKFISEYVTALQQMVATLEKHNTLADERYKQFSREHKEIIRRLGALEK